MSVSRPPTLARLFFSFAKIGAFTFGSGYAMIPMIRRELVEDKAWLTDEEFAEMVALVQTAPGALAVNTSVFAGYRLRGIGGALVCCLGAVLPSFITILAIATVFGRLRRLAVVEAMFRGMRPAIVGLILVAVLELGRGILRTWRQSVVAAVLFALDVTLNPHPIVVIILAALIG
ncbi:MAG: chromate transporter, partial [Firmicutes bacterium]|nr:chromate transporter [Bacillota bacterium]